MTLPILIASDWPDIQLALQSLADKYRLQTSHPEKDIREKDFVFQVYSGIRAGLNILVDIVCILKPEFSLRNRITIAEEIEKAATRYGSDTGYHFGLGTAAKIIRDAIEPPPAPH